MAKISVRPVTPGTWADDVALFSARRAPHYCWCTPCRFRDAHEMTGAAKQAAMHALVAARTPIGVVAYADGTPVGGCSVGHVRAT